MADLPTTINGEASEELQEISIHRKELSLSNGKTLKESQSIRSLIRDIVSVVNEKGGNIDIKKFDPEIYHDDEKVIDEVIKEVLWQGVDLKILGKKKLGRKFCLSFAKLLQNKKPLSRFFVI